MQRDAPPDLAELTLADLEQWVASAGLPRYRAAQIFQWVWRRGATSFDAMSDLPRELRARLSTELAFSTPTVVRDELSVDGTRKLVLRFADRREIECVYIPDTPSQTFCVSTQVGCAMGCAFCLTGRMGLVRHLTAGEIAGQVRVLATATGLLDRAFNIVLMGMGEPLHNYDNVARALRVLHDSRGLGLSRRRMTVSTAGLVPQIRQLCRDDLPCKLAVSLNAVHDELRSRLMPVNRKWPLDELFAACKEWTEATGQRVTFEYILMEGVNDRPEDIRALRARLSRLPCKLNLIYYNPTERGFQSSGEAVYQRFFQELQTAPFAVTLGQNMGTDIDAACGQLLVKEERAGGAGPAAVEAAA